jgi:predicted dehydrogenase
MAKPLNFALLGCGRIAKKHAEILAGGHVKGASLFGEKYGVPYFYDLSSMMMSRTPIDVVNVLTPSGDHAENTIEISKHGKHVVVEKPMALLINEADDMIAACDKAGVRLFVVKQNRYNAAVQELRKALDAGRFGKIVMGTVRVRWCRTQSYYDQDAWRGTWAEDGGVFSNQASHHVDLLEWMLGQPDSVFARTRRALADIEAEDTGIALLQFQGGSLGVIEATTATRPSDLEGSLSILGEKGSVVIGGFAVNKLETWQFEDELPSDATVMDRANQNPPNVYGFGHVPFLEHVVNCITSGSPALVDGLEGRRSLELISAIYESVETGREVAIRFRPKKCRLGHRN